jgi:glycosyltransferase involved in cell wall biosynthesis
MRVAFYDPSGAATASSPFGGRDPADLVAAAVAACDHDVECVSVASPEPAAADVAALIDRLRSGQHQLPDLWITSLRSPGAVDPVGPVASAALGIPYVLVPSLPPAGYELGDDRTEQLRRTLRQADATILFASAQAGLFSQLLPDHGDRLVLLPPFIDFGRVAAVVSRRATLRTALALQHRLSPDVPWLIAAGPVSTDVHLEVWHLVARAAVQASNLDWQLIVAASGPRRTEAEDLFRGLPRSLDRRVALGGPEDLTALLASGDIFLWPFDDTEGAVTALEAQAAGLAIIGPRSSSMLDVVANGQTGMLAKPDNIASFANAVTFMLRHPDFRRGFAQKAPQWVSANFDINVVAPRLSDALRRVSDAFRPGGQRTLA